MSGHSKWSKIKHQKGSADIKRGQSFTKIANAITIAVKQGGGIRDPNANFRLRLAIEKARQLNMPKENIKRAIFRGEGKSEAVQFEEIFYEGYGPGGVAILIEAATDNRQRTTAAVKNILEINGGNLASRGAVSYLFKTQGVIVVIKGSLTEEEILNKAIEAGISDFDVSPGIFIFYTAFEKLLEIKEKLIKNGLKVSSAEISLEPQSLIPVAEKGQALKIINLIKKLEELDDVQKVYSNFDICDNILNELNI